MVVEKTPSCELRGVPRACATLARSAFTLVFTPPHDKLHVDAERIAGSDKQPLVPPVADILPDLQARLGKSGSVEAGTLNLALIINYCSSR